MRWLVFFLLVLNALFFAWFYVQKDQQSLEVEASQSSSFNFNRSPSLTLLSELPASELRTADRRVAPAPVVEPLEEEAEVKAAEPSCLLLGPYAEVVSARQVKGRLKKMSAESDMLAIERELPPINWVYVKPSKDRKSALAVLKRLQQSNIDSFLVSEEGEYQFAISLGFFSNPESARKVLKQRKEQGYNAAITERVRTQDAYWVSIKPAFVEKITDEFMLALRQDFAEVKKQEKSCEDVALLKIIE